MMIPPPQLATMALTAIAKIASTVGPMLAKYTPIVIETLGKNLPKVVQTVETISSLIGVASTKDNAEQLGAKAIQAEKKPEDFDTINAYIDYLQSEVVLEENDAVNELDLLVQKTVGVSILIQGIGSKLQTEISIPFLAKTADLELDANTVLNVIKAYSEHSLNIDDFEHYLSDKLALNDTDKHSEVLITAYKTTFPEMEEEQIEDAILALR